MLMTGCCDIQPDMFPLQAKQDASNANMYLSTTLNWPYRGIVTVTNYLYHLDRAGQAIEAIFFYLDFEYVLMLVTQE